MIDAHEQHGRVGDRAARSSRSRRSRAYGCVAHEPVGDRLRARCSSIVEKPEPDGRAVQPGRHGPLRVHPRDLRRARPAPSPASAARSSSPTPSPACSPTRRSTATPSTRAATTSARSSTTCGPPSSWPSTATDLGPEFRGSWPAARRASRRRGHVGDSAGDPARRGPGPRRSTGCRAARAPGRRAAGRSRPWAACWPRRSSSPRGRAAVRQHRDGRLRRAGRRRRRRHRRARSSCRSWPRWPPGTRPTARSAPGEAVRIMTGAPMPDGADAVVMVERTERARRRRAVAIEAAVPAGQPRAAGRRRRRAPATWCSRAGDGARRRPPRRAGQLGVGEVRRAPAPRVGVLSTGDELVDGRRAAGARPDPRLATGRRCWRWWPRRAARPSTSACVRRRRGRHHRGHRARAPRRATPCSPAAACRWATSTS